MILPSATRLRAIDDHTPSDLQLEYYDRRSKYPGSLLIIEATFVSEQVGLYSNVPGIWNENHVEVKSLLIEFMKMYHLFLVNFGFYVEFVIPNC